MREAMALSGQRGRLNWALVLGAGLLGIAGCGERLYEERLENTRKLYSHLELLDANLHRDWVDPDYGVRLRVPLKFGMIAATAAPSGSLSPDASQGTKAEAPAGADDRQPKYLNVELPGLRAAFAANLRILAVNGGAADDSGFIYVLTNHHLANSGERARTFHADLVAMLAQALHTAVKPEDWSEPKFPMKVGTFAETVAYKLAVISPREPIFGVERQFSVYMHQEGDVQVVILCVFPKDVDASEKLAERMPLCLETLRVPGDKLSRPAPAAGGTPSKGPAAGF
jgi:hypothetical protein